MDEKSKNGKKSDKLDDDDQKRSIELNVELGNLSLKAEGSELTEKPTAQSEESESDKASAEQFEQRSKELDLGQEDEGNQSLEAEGSELMKNPAARSEELSESEKNFVEHFKRRRMELSFTQEGVGRELGSLYGNTYTYKTIYNFENQRIPARNMRRLLPILQNWLDQKERDNKEEAKEKSNN